MDARSRILAAERELNALNRKIEDKEAVIASVPSDPAILMAGLKGDALDADVPEIRKVTDQLSVLQHRN